MLAAHSASVAQVAKEAYFAAFATRAFIVSIDDEQRIVGFNKGAEDTFGWMHRVC